MSENHRISMETFVKKAENEISKDKEYLEIQKKMLAKMNKKFDKFFIQKPKE